MKKKLLVYGVFVFISAIWLIACKKNTVIVEEAPQQINIDSLLNPETPSLTVPLIESSTASCNTGPKYKDSIIHLEANTGLYIVKPINDPGPGKYFSWPKGLVLDSLTGSINVNASETGTRYIIGFIKDGTRDTCLSSIILAGASYVDGIYPLTGNETLVRPYFNANMQNPSICVVDPNDTEDNNGSGTGNDQCRFIASNKKLKVGDITGTIDLKASVADGVFGPNPTNGQTARVNIIYQLKDQSNMAIQRLDIQLIYYNTQADIPQALSDYVNQKTRDIMLNRIISAKGNPRPPVIIITRS